jgi:hypothetical protein
MVNLGVIAKQDEPTDWVSSMVVVRKPGKLRICLDPKDLNRAIKRELRKHLAHCLTKYFRRGTNTKW